MNTEEILAEALPALEGLKSEFVVVGGTAHRLLCRAPEATPVDFEPLATLDIDVLVPAEHPIAGGELLVALTARGFEPELRRSHSED